VTLESSGDTFVVTYLPFNRIEYRVLLTEYRFLLTEYRVLVTGYMVLLTDVRFF